MEEEVDKGTFGCGLGIFIFFVLFIFGAYWDYKLSPILRIGYLLGIPLLIGMIIPWLLDRLDVTNKTMILLSRIMSISVGLFLVFSAIFLSQQTSHWDTILVDKGNQTFEEEVLVKGTNRGNVFICILFAIFFFMYGLRDIKIKTWFKSNNEQ